MDEPLDNLPKQNHIILPYVKSITNTVPYNNVSKMDKLLSKKFTEMYFNNINERYKDTKKN